MRTLKSLLLVSFLSSVAIPQDVTKRDPLLGRYILANSAELISITDLRWTPAEPRLTLTLCDFEPTGQIVTATAQAGYSDTEGLSSARRAASAAGDFNGDGKDELVSAWEGPAKTLNLHMLLPRRPTSNLTNWQWSGATIAERTTDTVKGPIRMIAANLDLSPRQEIVVCYRVEGGLKVTLYDSVDAATQKPVKYGSVMFDDFLFGIQDYDLAAGDFDYDGLDEVIFAFHTLIGTDHRLALHLAELNPATKQLEMWGGASFYTDSIAWTNTERLKVTAGDFRNLGYDEAVVSATRTSGTLGVQAFSYVTIDTGAHSFSMEFPVLATMAPCVGQMWYGWESDAAAGDLNPLKEDGEELVMAGPGEITVLRFDSAGTPSCVARAGFLNPGMLETYERRRFVAVADLDADTTSASSWMPEIILAEHPQDSTTDIRTFSVNLSPEGTITGLTQIAVKKLYSSDKTRVSEIVVGDFDGDAIRIGSPKLLTVQNFGQPVVVLNVPPTHFDSLNGQVYDVCKAYGANVSQFRATYSQKNSQTSYFSSEMSQSVGLATEVAGGFKFWGIKVRASMGKSFEQGYYGSRSTESTISVTEELTSWQDDWALATVADYDLWEYPLYAGGEYKGGVVVQIPHLNPFSGRRWLPGKDQSALTWMADHEVGNLLSYMPPNLFVPWVGADLLTTFTAMTVSSGSQMHYSLDLEGRVSDESQLSNAVGCELGLSVSGWGMEARVSGTYSSEEVVTHTSTATDEVTVGVDLAAPDQAIAGTSYIVTPAIYWGRNGALTVDYAVELPEGSPGLWSFWGLNYKAHPDPAFILPWRLDAEKGVGLNPNMKLFCKSLHVSPIVPFAGDTARITARVHNFSLMGMTSPTVVRFYLGNPASGGIQIVGLGNLTELTTGLIGARDHVTLEMDWVVPPGLDNSARVYAVIDPQNSMAEIHEDNNIGFFPLWAGGTTDVEDEPEVVVPTRYCLGPNYPNPFNPSTVIPFEVPVKAHVSLAVYDMLGRRVAILVDDVVEAGHHQAVFDAKALAAGMYFCRLEAGEFSMTIKMIMLK